MPPLLLRAGLRHLGRHPLQAFLAVTGIALGVAVVLSLELAIESSRQAIRASVATVGGQATHRLEGGPGGVPSELVARARTVPGVRAAGPAVEGYAASRLLPGRTLRILGVDPLSEGRLRPFLGAGAEALALVRLLAEGQRVVVGAALAQETGLEGGEILPIRIEGRDVDVRIAALLEPEDALARAGLRDVLIADIAAAQELVGRFGSVDRIDLVLDEERTDEAVAALGGLLPDGVRLREGDARGREMQAMIRSFDLNLTALGFLALLFGAFLIYNTMTFSVVQRRRTLGTFRALGATRGELLRTIMAEALLLGAVGTIVGLLLGSLLGRGLVHLVTRTINDLYFVLSVEGVSIAPSSLAKAVVLGIGVTALASVPATWEATSTSPRRALGRSFLEERARTSAGRLAWTGLLLIAGGIGFLLVPTASVAPAFGGLFLLVLGMAAFTPAAVAVGARLLAPFLRRTAGLLGAMSARGVADALSRTGPAVTALVVAVSVTLGLGIMISSFRGSVEGWLDVTLASDVYVALPSAVSARPGGTLPPEIVDALSRAPEVRSVSLTRSAEVMGEAGPLRLLAVTGRPDGPPPFQLTSGSGSPEEVRARVERGEGLLVSEPLAFRRGLAAGDDLRLRTPEGERAFPILGVFRDYGSDQGVVVLARPLYVELWQDPDVTSMGLSLQQGIGVEEGLAALRARLPSGAVVNLRSNRELREATLLVFDRTFRITSVLQALVFLVAFIGVVSALMALQLERMRELGVLRAGGLLPGEVWWVVMGQTGLLGLLAGLLAVPVGLVVALVMTGVVNRRSFGWTVETAVSPEIVVQAILLAVTGALVAGLYPSWKMSRTAPAEALREE